VDILPLLIYATYGILHDFVIFLLSCLSRYIAINTGLNEFVYSIKNHNAIPQGQIGFNLPQVSVVIMGDKKNPELPTGISSSLRHVRPEKLTCLKGNLLGHISASQFLVLENVMKKC
jgi:hypothetical protein